jgi:hypothetical protein
MIPHQDNFADIAENRPALLIPGFLKRRRRLRRGHPEIQHRRMHRTDQGNRESQWASTRSMSQIGRADARTLSQMPPGSIGTPVK